MAVVIVHKVIFIVLVLAFIASKYESECKYVVIPERAYLKYLNDKYIIYGKVNVRRHNRRSPYYINIEGAIKHTWGNNITYHMIFNEFLNNEYKRSFVEFHYKLCDLIMKDMFVGLILRSSGLTCPVAAKEYHFMNITVPTQNFHNVFPFEKTRIDVTLEIADTKELVLDLQVYAVIKREKN